MVRYMIISYYDVFYFSRMERVSYYVCRVQRKYKFVALGWGPDQEACPTNVMEWF